MTIKTLLLILLAVVFTADIACAVSRDPDELYNATQLITSKGYPAELHHVTTRDRYILGVHRIPHGKNTNKTAKTATSVSNKTRPVFFLQHGLLCSSTNWLTNLANESLAYILADNGFDVWMGNVRGNTYSRNHKTLKTDSKQFWEFSFDEHSLIDLPAMIDHVLSVTKQDKIFYLGHSQGTMMGFAGFTHNRTLASRIHKFYALAPVATVQYITGLFGYVAKYYKVLEPIVDIGDGEFFSNNDAFMTIAKGFCQSAIEEVCSNVLFVICGFDETNINSSRIPVYLSHTPAATSVQNVVHWAQMVHSGNFQMYDYGSKKTNQEHYHQDEPPLYKNLTNMIMPLHLFTGGHDYLADPQDVKRLVDTLQPVMKDNLTRLDIPEYNHLDFIWGLDVHSKVYSVVIQDALEVLKRIDY